MAEGGRRKVGWFTCTAIVIANMVGTGVFTSLGFQVGDLPSGFVILVLWAVGAMFALCGALCYAELAAALPRSGGEYNFLSRIYGRPVGFMGGFVSATVGFAAPVTLASMAFGKYLGAVFPGVPGLAASTILVIIVTAAHLVTLDMS
ncbi:MAG: amino acid permease, partial [Chthoniobacterales bacterium]